MSEQSNHTVQIAQRLRAARQHAGLSQGQVANLLDLHRPTISTIESGKRRVSAEEVARLADIYGVSVSWIITNESEAPEPEVALAARELAKLAPSDLDTLLQLIRSLRHGKNPS